jgi:hypothetical protein
MRIGLLACFLVVAAAPARADEWATPTTRYLKSDSGRYRAVVVPGEVDKKRPASITLFDDRDPTRPKRLYGRAAVNRWAPAQVLVADSGHLVTLDEWHHAGFEHALVIYDRKGRVVIDCALEQLLLPDELPQVKQSKSSRWWRAERHAIWLEGGAVLIKTSWGQVVRFDLASGAQSRDGQRVAVPGAEKCRARRSK